MITLLSTEMVNTLRKAIASAAFATVVLIAPAVSAQTITAQSNASAITNSANKFQAVIYPVENSVNVNINVVNPQAEKVTITIYDNNKSAVYKKNVGTEALYRGKFDMSMLADGEYTVIVKSGKDSYTRTISVKTQRERFTSAI
jgi:hypothetical protein